MLLVGLTGGIGSGKSTVSSLLAGRGAVIIDADRIAREVVEPDGPAYDAVVARFGDAVLDADRRIDRPALAAIVFNDAEALKDLNGIVHPAVGAVMAEKLAAETGTDHVVVMDIPLLVEGGREHRAYAAVLVVDTPPEVALRRLVEQRGMDEADARARMANQASREDRLAVADHVIDNAGSLEALEAEIDRAWAYLQTLPHAEEEQAGTG